MNDQVYNDFCMLCTGNNKEDIVECGDMPCPFFQFKRGGLERDVEREICQKLMVTMRMVK